MHVARFSGGRLSVPLSLVSRPPILVPQTSEIYNAQPSSPLEGTAVYWYDGWHQVHSKMLTTYLVVV